MKNMLAVGFYPSYAAFTFPLVISATAMFKSALFFANHPLIFGFLQALTIIETSFAVIVVSYVLGKYAIHLYQQTKALIAGHSY